MGCLISFCRSKNALISSFFICFDFDFFRVGKSVCWIRSNCSFWTKLMFSCQYPDFFKPRLFKPDCLKSLDIKTNMNSFLIFLLESFSPGLWMKLKKPSKMVLIEQAYKQNLALRNFGPLCIVCFSWCAEKLGHHRAIDKEAVRPIW